MDKNILIIVVFVVGILAGGSLGYGISSLRADELDRKIEDLDSGISSFNEYISRLEVKIENLSENFDEILKILGSIKNQSYQNQSIYKNNAEKFDWLSGFCTISKRIPQIKIRRTDIRMMMSILLEI